MTTVTNPSTTDSTWGESNPLRGRNFRNHALQFIKDFPMGSILTNEDFDKWAHRYGYLNIPDSNVDKQSDAWLAHLTRRNQLRKSIFKASTHVEMMTYGAECFVITQPKGGTGVMIIEPPQVALQQTQFAEKLESLIGTKRRQLGYLMQSIDFVQMPPHQKALAENLYDELSDWNGEVQLRTKNLDRRMVKLINQIRTDISTGITIPKNHALENLIANIDVPETDDI